MCNAKSLIKIHDKINSYETQKPFKYEFLSNFPSPISCLIQVWLVWFIFTGVRSMERDWKWENVFTKRQARVDIPEWDSESTAWNSTESFHFILLISILVTFDIWRNKSLQSLLLVFLPRALKDCQNICTLESSNSPCPAFSLPTLSPEEDNRLQERVRLLFDVLRSLLVC